MIALVLGGSGSGKSEFAEALCVKLDSEEKLYIATMYPWDDESKKRIARHIKLRQGKKFRTVECFYHMKETMKKVDLLDRTILLECMSNLVANEMYCKEAYYDQHSEQSDRAEQLVNHIVEDILWLEQECEHVVIVSNDVFSDGITYGAEMVEYLNVLAYVNRRIAKNAHLVIEVAAGIPMVRKGADCYEKIME